MPETNACALAAADLVWLLQDCRRRRSRGLSPNDLAFPCQAARLEFEKVRPLPLQIAEENQSICASCLLRGRNVFRRPIVPLLQDEPLASPLFILASNFAARLS
jgi:hypothetical protein